MWVRQITSGSLSTCLCSQSVFIDFNTPIEKLPLNGVRWTGALQLRTGHQSSLGSVTNCHCLNAAPGAEIHRAVCRTGDVNNKINNPLIKLVGVDLNLLL